MDERTGVFVYPRRTSLFPVRKDYIDKQNDAIRAEAGFRYSSYNKEIKCKEEISGCTGDFILFGKAYRRGRTPVKETVHYVILQCQIRQFSGRRKNAETQE